MAIPEEQLETWCNQAGSGASMASHQLVRRALLADDSPIKNSNPEIFLQGSYRNDTNIRGDSDVDVVVLISRPWYADLSLLASDQKQVYLQARAVVPYGAIEWRADVEKALRKKFGTALKPGGGKAFRVVTGPGNMTADVLPALLHKQYRTFQSFERETFDPGVEFADSGGNRTINFPKLHIENGEKKNAANVTRGNYKSTVRMLKNARNSAVERGLLRDGAAPSYFVECLLYNVTNDAFVGTRQEVYHKVVAYLLSAPLDGFSCQNGQLRLFGPSSVQWNIADAKAFVMALAILWDNWR